MDWQILDLHNVPSSPGVYGFKQGDLWLYIGRAKNLSKRLTKHHIPLQIALSLSGTTFHYYSTEHPGRLEYRLIEQLEPEWNGHTSIDCGSKYPTCQSGVLSERERDLVDAIGELL
jgi:excinuclease UvrABC nuclease subunit